MSFVLCVGPNPALQRTLWFPELRLGEVNRARRRIVSGGGKGTNVARVLGQLGQRARLLTFVGGAVGDELVQILAREGIDAEVVRTASPTRVCITLIEEGVPRQTEVVEEAEPLTEEDVCAFREAFVRLLPEASMVVISGTCPPGTPESFYAELVSFAERAGLRVVVDAPGRLLLRAAESRPLLAKPNRKELEAVFPGLPLEEQVHRLHEAGAENVFVTDGGHSAYLLTPDGGFRLYPPQVQPVNPIGSGDAAAAGIVFALLQGKGMLDAVRFGVACGTANTQTPLAGNVLPSDVERLFPLVRAEKWE
jgi:1-phosphofructokinase family hexose kinase